MEFVASVMALRSQHLPPTAFLHTADPRCDLDYVPLTARPRAGLSSPKMGDRLLKIASELRRRAAELNVPLRASVRFVVESELRASQSPA